MTPPDRAPLSHNHRQPCAKCGAHSTLRHVEPSADADHDVRTFECPVCGHVDVVTVKFR